MMHNDPKRPEIARESQDVESPPQRVEEAPHHTGRGRFLDCSVASIPNQG